MDKLTPGKRSWNMSRISSKNTKPEKMVRTLLHLMGFRFRLHRKELPGSPDIVLAKYRTVLFVNGCFWHRHKNCKYAYTPKTRIEFWEQKFQENISRDRKNYNRLRRKKWNIIIVWECQLKDPVKLADKVQKRLKKYIEKL